ncbi:MAG: hypothetical protein ACOYN0_19235, partial [Phycisphaerales bacterium]
RLVDTDGLMVERPEAAGVHIHGQPCYQHRRRGDRACALFAQHPELTDVVSEYVIYLSLMHYAALASKGEPFTVPEDRMAFQERELRLGEGETFRAIESALPEFRSTLVRAFKKLLLAEQPTPELMRPCYTLMSEVELADAEIRLAGQSGLHVWPGLTDPFPGGARHAKT